jgi:hypothetical protein
MSFYSKLSLFASVMYNNCTNDIATQALTLFSAAARVAVVHLFTEVMLPLLYTASILLAELHSRAAAEHARSTAGCYSSNCIAGSSTLVRYST